MSEGNVATPLSRDFEAGSASELDNSLTGRGYEEDSLEDRADHIDKGHPTVIRHFIDKLNTSVSLSHGIVEQL